MEVLKTRTCERCKAQVPLNRVRLFPKDADRNWMVCENCCEVLRNMNMTQVGRTMPAIDKKEPVRNVFQQKAPVQPFRPKELATPARPGMSQRISDLAREKGEAVRNVYKVREPPVPFRPSPSANDLVATTTHKNLFCARCNFTFKVDKEKVGLLHRLSCPYCGKSDKLQVAKAGK